MNINVNRMATFLPIKKISSVNRTAAGRLNLARDLNDKLLDSVLDKMDDGKITLPAFVRLIKKASGSKLEVTGTRLCAGPEGLVSHKVKENNTFSGYVLGIPFAYGEKFIKISNLKRALKCTQLIFDEFTNPKFFARIKTMQNKGFNTVAINEFSANKIRVAESLTKKDLKEFMKSMSLEEKIESLQALRYNVLHFQNWDKFSKHYMQKMNQNPKFKLKFGEDSINSNRYMYQEKLDLINQELASLIKMARAKK